MVAYTTKASGLMQDDPQQLAWSNGKAVNSYSGLNGSFVNVALRVLPIDAKVGGCIQCRQCRQCSRGGEWAPSVDSADSVLEEVSGRQV
jgi:hypothetical protein